MSEIPPFDRKFFASRNKISRIGGGSLGGKAMGLLSIQETIRHRFPPDRFKGVEVSIPRMTVIGTDGFDDFIKHNNLQEVAFSGLPDDRIAHEFQKASLPAKIVGDLRTLANEVKTPLAIRSSSLLEDKIFRPFAGVYETKMIPNNQPGSDVRFRRLSEAVKFVWASTYFKDARCYIQSVEKDTADEKMAVIIQEVVGKRRYDRFYPTVSGVARSYNFYPTGHAEPDDGVVSLALGLGKTIVEGGLSWSYSVAYPKAPPLYNNVNDMMKNTQTEFWAVNMARAPVHNPIRETEYLVKAHLEEAEYDNNLKFIASTYNAPSDRIVPGTGPDGPRIVNFAPLLVFDDVPFNDIVEEMLNACEQELDAKVEIEFAMSLDIKKGLPAWLGFLQVRPTVISDTFVEVPFESLSDENALVASENVLGNGMTDTIKDIVYVRPDAFEPKHSQAVAREIDKINTQLVQEERPYMLIGFGRLGTSDPWKGIPGTWSQFSGARVMVEAPFEGMETEFSQGSHFFHNMTSFKVFFFSVSSTSKYNIDWDWIEQLEEVKQGKFVRHVRTDAPLAVMVDGRIRRGVILHHERG